MNAFATFWQNYTNCFLKPWLWDIETYLVVPTPRNAQASMRKRCLVRSFKKYKHTKKTTYEKRISSVIGCLFECYTLGVDLNYYPLVTFDKSLHVCHRNPLP